MRTDDTSYGAEYWDTLDGGAGYKPSLLWLDIAHIISEVFFVDREAGKDRSGEFRVVDVGCAYGYLVKSLRERGCETFGLDYSRYALDRAPDEVKDVVQWFDLTRPNDSFYGREQFNLLVSFETLEHIPADGAEQAVEHLWNLLSPGGTALLTICTEDQPNPHDDPTHYNVRSRAYWEELFAAQGFRQRSHERLIEFWPFNQHKGVFVLEKPKVASASHAIHNQVMPLVSDICHHLLQSGKILIERDADGAVKLVEVC